MVNVLSVEEANVLWPIIILRYARKRALTVVAVKPYQQMTHRALDFLAMEMLLVILD
jgi:hypothetical protein